MTKEKDCKETDAEINVEKGGMKMSYKTFFAVLIFVAVAATGGGIGWGVAGNRLTSLEKETTNQGADIKDLRDTVIRIETQYDTIIRALQRIEEKG